MIKNFTPRLYQETILGTAALHNTLVVLPTGLGKTAVSVLLASKQLSQYPGSKILVLAPTRPLIDQHLKSFKNFLDFDESKFAVFTGFVSPLKRQELWKDAQIIFSTPQGLENDVISGKIKLDDVSLLVFDEAHRAVKDYSYVWIAKQYEKLARHPKILGLTASPGSDLESISEVCKNLFIEEIEVRDENDPDVKPYVQETITDWVGVVLPEEFVVVKKFLDDCYRSKIGDVKQLGVVSSAQLGGSKSDLLRLQASLHVEISGGDKCFEVLKSVSLIAEALKVQHALELIETQDPSALKLYFEKLQQQSVSSKVQAVKNLVRDINFKSAVVKTDSLVERGLEHPKTSVLRELLRDEVAKDKDVKIIVFTQYRDVGSKIVGEINKVDGVVAKLFVGQAKKNGSGMSQKEQGLVLDDFRAGKFNVVCMTSVGEEGLDIPSVDLVVFYEPVPSAIRTIQRRGRTGRNDKGRVVVLFTKNTRDEAYRWSAHHKEKRMYRNLDLLRKTFKGSVNKRVDADLKSFVKDDDKLKVFCDFREKGSGVIKELVDLGINVRLEKLDCADYVVSQRVGVEFKTVQDFVDSIIDGRLLQQVKELKRNFDRPLIVVEGDGDIYSVRNIHPNAIRGMLATIAVSFGVPVLQTKNFRETAALLNIIAKREQEDSCSNFSLHGDRKPMSQKELQEYVISSFPNVGPAVAKELLLSFKSVKNIVNADVESLKKVDKVGDKIASGIKELVDKEYS